MTGFQGGWKRLLNADALLALLAVGAGIGGSVLADRYLDAREAASEARVAGRYTTRQVVVAASDLPRGELLAAGSLAARAMPSGFVPADAVPVEQAQALLGTRTSIPIRRGTPVVAGAVQADGQVLRLSSVLASGERALTISVDETGSQAGALRPGDAIDLFYSRNDGGESLLVPLLQQVEILAVGATTSAAAFDDGEATQRLYATITLRVDESAVPRILLAQQSGQIGIVLRAGSGGRLIDSAVRSSRELLRAQPSSTVGTRSGVELLVGGNGGQAPQRSWLQFGRGVVRIAEAT